MSQSRGIVFATTKEFFTNMARKTARNMRAIAPDLQIDLFTDQDIDDPTFDQIHKLEGGGNRPKMEAMRRNRFDLSYTIDSDIITVARFDEIFDLLMHFDLACAQCLGRSHEMMDDPRIPHAFPVFNSGVFGVRKSDATQTFLHAWEDQYLASPAKIDQPVLRHLIWESDLRMATLPPAYNFMRPGMLRHQLAIQGAPRFLHILRLEKMDCSDPLTAFELSQVFNPSLVAHIEWLIATDHSLGGDPNLPPPDSGKAHNASKPNCIHAMRICDHKFFTVITN